MGGRIQHHLLQRLPDPRNLILFIGFQALGTRGRQIKDGQPQVKIFGEIVPVRAHVAAIEQFSDHADTPELLEWLRTFKNQPGMTYLVHGEPAASEALRQAISQQLKWNVEIAKWMEKVPIGDSSVGASS
jgi:metallo-beta-lactamase family protein